MIRGARHVVKNLSGATRRLLPCIATVHPLLDLRSRTFILSRHCSFNAVATAQCDATNSTVGSDILSSNQAFDSVASILAELAQISPLISIEQNVSRTATKDGFLFSNGAVYVGHVVKKKCHGFGKISFPDGTSYEGNWLNDQPHGVGTITAATPFKYTYLGELKTGKKCGLGQISCPTWNYFGEWGNNLMEGSGVLTVDGQAQGQGRSEHYSGEYKAGVPHGQGVYTFPNGEVYTGAFEEGKRHGAGSTVMPDGSRHEGEYRNGQTFGKGKITHAPKTDSVSTVKQPAVINSDDSEVAVDSTVRSSTTETEDSPEGHEAPETYVGDLTHGNTKHGVGVLNYPNGDIYEGEFVDGQCDGWGKLTFKTGITYTGDFFRGQMHGWGVLCYPEGTVFFRGEFAFGKKNGYGVIDNPGWRYAGNWVNNKRHGEGMLDGRYHYYVGGFFEGKKQGFGKQRTKQSINKYEGEFKRDKMDGRGKLVTNKGVMLVGEFVDGFYVHPPKHSDTVNEANSKTQNSS